jgi:hypothetical protein
MDATTTTMMRMQQQRWMTRKKIAGELQEKRTKTRLRRQTRRTRRRTGIQGGKRTRMKCESLLVMTMRRTSGQLMAWRRMMTTMQDRVQQMTMRRRRVTDLVAPCLLRS